MEFLGGQNYIGMFSWWEVQLASVVQLHARPTEDQEVAGSIPAGSVTFFREDWSWYIFYGLFLPSTDTRRAVISFWRKNEHNA